MLRRSLALLAVIVTVVALAAPVVAQEPTGSTTTIGVPAQDIVPEPNSGRAASAPGDRGGSLQLGLLALVVVVIGAAIGGLVRQSRRARATPS